MARDPESFTENELAVLQIKALRRMADAFERNNELMELAFSEEIARARKKLPAEGTGQVTGIDREMMKKLNTVTIKKNGAKSE